MTATEPANPVCPECGNRNTMVLSDGMARCFDDQHEWNPAEVSALPRSTSPRVAPLPAADVQTVAREPEAGAGGVPAAEPRDESQHDVPEPSAPASFTQDEMIGGTARLEGGQTALVLSFPDDDHVVVRLNDGRDETVSLSDVERITPRAPVEVIEVADAAHAEVAEWIGDVEALSNLMLKAGVATVYETPEALVVGEPPRDWLPRDQSSNALVEAAVAVSIARLIVAYELDCDDILEGTGGTPPADEGATEAQEVTSEPSTDTT